MSDDIIATVQARIKSEQARMQELDAQIETLRATRARAEGEVARLLQFAKTYFELTGIQPQQNLEQYETGIDTPKRPKNPSREIVAATALDIIQEAGRPMARKELFDALAARGVIIKGKDPEMVLSTMLWREQGKVVRLPNHGYWPKDVANAAAGYDPDFDEIIGAAATEPEGGVEADDAE